MANLSTYSPLYIRAGGDDATGDGSLAAPFATPQKAFETAYMATGDFVLDLGAGNFGGVNLIRIDDDGNTLFDASEWPSRISVRGVSSALSSLGGVDSSGGLREWTGRVYIPAKNIAIVSDNTVSLGDIKSIGINQLDSAGYPTPGGSVTLTNAEAGTIYADGGHASPGWGNFGCGGSVTLHDSHVFDISVCGGDGAGGSSGGTAVLYDSTCRDIFAHGGSSNYEMSWGGSVTLTNSTARNISVFGTVNVEAGLDGSGGSVGLLNGSTAASISGLAGIVRVGRVPFTGTYEGTYYEYGVAFTGLYDDGNGSKYYRDGVLGTGLYDDGDGSKYYKDGVLFTGLYNNGNGSKYYVDGVLFTGFSDGTYYVEGSLANGVYEGVYYVDGSPGTGVYAGQYYVDGRLANGVYAGIYYVDGSPGTGVYEGVYYVDGSPANGTYDGVIYVEGVGYYPSTSFPQPSQVLSGVSYGNGLTGTLIKSNPVLTYLLKLPINV
jgi:hypothetical protein